MPHPKDFLLAFALYKGKVLEGNGCIITKVACSHKVVKQYQEYEFPLTLTLSATSMIGDAKLDCSPRIVYSQYGNPYTCHLENVNITRQSSYSPLDGGPRIYEITVTALGRAVRKSLLSQ